MNRIASRRLLRSMYRDVDACYATYRTKLNDLYAISTIAGYGVCGMCGLYSHYNGAMTGGYAAGILILNWGLYKRDKIKKEYDVEILQRINNHYNSEFINVTGGFNRDWFIQKSQNRLL